MSAWRIWRAFADCCGWVIPDEKSPMPEDVMTAIGAYTDMSAAPDAPVTLQITEKLRAKALDTIDHTLKTNSIFPAAAAKLCGQLNWTSSAQFGSFGRCKLRPIRRRSLERGRSRVNPQMREALHWWKRTLVESIPRELVAKPADLPLVISYSDGEGGDAGVGVALWSSRLPGGPEAGFMKVPPELRALWSHQRARSRWNDIYQIEGVAPLLILTHWSHVLQGALWLHFIDNEAAQAALVGGSSSTEEGDLIMGCTWSHIVRLGVRPWFDRVSSHANPVDGLSRGRWRGPWKYVRSLTAPRELRMALANASRRLPPPVL